MQIRILGCLGVLFPFSSFQKNLTTIPGLLEFRVSGLGFHKLLKIGYNKGSIRAQGLGFQG